MPVVATDNFTGAAGTALNGREVTGGTGAWSVPGGSTAARLNGEPAGLHIDERQSGPA